jgi:hypothetical protein
MPKGAKYGGGSRKGSPNKTTGRAKEIILAAIDKHSDNFESVMDYLQEENPTEYAKIMVSLMKFVMPVKTDVTTNGESVNIAPPATVIFADGTKIEI